MDIKGNHVAVWETAVLVERAISKRPQKTYFENIKEARALEAV